MSFPEQNQYYSETFHLIDKGNQNEAKYDIGFESHKHGWLTKLVARLFNMNLNNAYQVYKALVQQHTPNNQHFTMREAVFEATQALLQKGEPMRTQAAQHPDSKRCLTKMWCTISGRKLCTDAKGGVARFGKARLGSAIQSHL